MDQILMKSLGYVVIWTMMTYFVRFVGARGDRHLFEQEFAERTLSISFTQLHNNDLYLSL